MSVRRSFVFDFFPQDFLTGIVGMDDAVVGVYMKLISLMHVYEGPLPPRSTKLARGEFDEWLRDKLGHKNVRTWLRAKRLLLADPDKLIELPDGRIINPRVARDLDRRRAAQRERNGGGGQDQGGGSQGALTLVPPVDRAVDEGVERAGEVTASGDDRANIARSSGDVRSIRRSNPLMQWESRAVFPYPCIHIPHEIAAAGTRFPRARGDPHQARA